MESAKIFGTPVEIKIPGVHAFLHPITFEILSRLGETITKQKIASVPTVESLMATSEIVLKDFQDVNARFEKYRQLLAESAYLVADLGEKARKSDLEEITDSLQNPMVIYQVLKMLMRNDKGEPSGDDVASAVTVFVGRNGMSNPDCNLSRWLEISGLVDAPNPTTSENAS